MRTNIRNGHAAVWNNRDKFKQTLSQFDDVKRASIVEKRKQTNMQKFGGRVPSPE